MDDDKKSSEDTHDEADPKLKSILVESDKADPALRSNINLGRDRNHAINLTKVDKLEE